ncbi:kinesin-like protein KIN-14B [Malania oleifera]|uniref:kinesin-like protein KIN-14B n=1 Tax=Malania oleifera TaxID=397392 RepID=UPI0025ADC621|nr:kinesin-like protein KIN-14B [Malania oleifera]
MDSRQSVRNLTETIYSLLDSTTNLTPSWADSVCEIVKSLPPKKEQSGDSNIENHATIDSFDNSFAETEDELAALTSRINQLNIQRRQVLNDFLDLKGNIRVYCRVRPITLGKSFSQLSMVKALDSSNVLLTLAENKSKIYNFDKVFNPDSSQDEVFSEIEPVIKSAIDGYNACIFAYGQTGTGKTFTMEGTADNPGVVHRTLEALFKQADDSNQAFLFSFSMLEIYLGNLKDLLVPPSTSATDPLPSPLAIQTRPKGGVEIDNLVTIQVSDFKQALRLYKLGCRFRSTASTNSNIRSSRSHCMIRIAMTCFDAPERQRETNKIWMVDLGGSERLLKTKARGRRFEEGKAINLSLSALGDVINALQRKARHIPYRNSKLTQILKDSLGEDSKTLMLVHISPKEEDLCETVCSLNFAIRVRSIHLACEEPTEVRYNKAVAMTTLQQKLKHIEDERHDIRRKVETLNKRLENLTRVPPSSCQPVDAFHLSTEVPQYSIEKMNNRNGNVKASSLSSPQPPRFMRPTICSRKKSNTTPEDRFLVHERKSRTLSHHARSETIPVRNISEYNSECGISRTSCLRDLHMKYMADNETECSLETSVCDIKTVVFPEEEISPRSSGHQKSCLSCSKGNGSKRINEVKAIKFMKVDNWLHSHKGEPSASGYTHRSKQELSIPTTELNHVCKWSKAETLHDKEVHNHKFTKKKAVNHDKVEKKFEECVNGRSMSEMMTKGTPALSRNLFDKESRCTSTPPHIIHGKIMIQTQCLVENLLIEDNKRSIFLPLHMWYDSFSEKDQYGVHGMSTVEVIANETHSSFNKNGSDHFTPFDNDNTIDDLRENSGFYIPISEQELHHQQVPIEMAMEDKENGDLHDSCQQLQKGMIPSRNEMRSRKVLFMDNANQKDLTMFLPKEQRNTQKRGENSELNS